MAYNSDAPNLIDKKTGEQELYIASRLDKKMAKLWRRLLGAVLAPHRRRK